MTPNKQNRSRNKLAALIKLQASTLALTLCSASLGLAMDQNNQEQQVSPMISDGILIKMQNAEYAQCLFTDAKKELTKFQVAFNTEWTTGLPGKLFALCKEMTTLENEIDFDSQRLEETGGSNQNLQKKIGKKKITLEILCNQKKELLNNPELSSIVDTMEAELKRLTRLLKTASAGLLEVNIAPEDVSTDLQHLNQEIGKLKQMLPIPNPAPALPRKNIIQIMNYLNTMDYRSSACVSWDWLVAGEEFKGSAPFLVLQLASNYMDLKTFHKVSPTSLKWKHSTKSFIKNIPTLGKNLIKVLSQKNFKEQLSFLPFCSLYSEKNSTDLFYESYESYFALPEEERFFCENGKITKRTNECLNFIQDYLSKNPTKTIGDLGIEHENITHIQKAITNFRPYELCLMTSAFLEHQKAKNKLLDIYGLSTDGSPVNQNINDEIRLLRNILLNKNADGQLLFSFLNCPNLPILENLEASKMFLEEIPQISIYEFDKKKYKENEVLMKSFLLNADYELPNMIPVLGHTFILQNEIRKLLSLPISECLIIESEIVSKYYTFLEKNKKRFTTDDLSVTQKSFSKFFKDRVKNIFSYLLKENILKSDQNTVLHTIERVEAEHKDWLTQNAGCGWNFGPCGYSNMVDELKWYEKLCEGHQNLLFILEKEGTVDPEILAIVKNRYSEVIQIYPQLQRDYQIALFMLNNTPEGIAYLALSHENTPLPEGVDSIYETPEYKAYVEVQNKLLNK